MDIEPPKPTAAEWAAGYHKWTQGRRRIVFPGVFLIYLLQVAGAVAKDTSGASAVAGYIVLLMFCGCYLLALPEVWRASSGRFWILYGALVALFIAETPFAHADAFVMCVYIAVISVARLGAGAAPVVLAMTLAAVFVPWAVPSWRDHLSAAFNIGTAITIPVTALAMFGFVKVLRGNQALAEARSELARLGAESERSRIARDLHDLLGHSLTTITVKAGLARRLGAGDFEGALREIGEVEELSRRALSEVRAAVASYRDVTLAGELATGRELLRAAGIAADLPRAVDIVDLRHQELFGWVLREGLTNVVRHAHAGTCAVRFSTSSVEIVDDGVGGTATSGNGLAGLRERVEAAGGVVDAGPAVPGGWRLRVSLRPEGRVLA